MKYLKKIWNSGRHSLSVAGSLILFLTSGHAQTYPNAILPTDTISPRASSSLPSLGYVVRTTAPLLGLSLVYNLSNHHVADARHRITPHFRSRYDDYMQFTPLALQLGLHLGGIEGSSASPWQMLTSDLIAVVIMQSTVTSLKYSIGTLRPDGSAHNSFPSGHTAMAFASATLLHLEYGDRIPWLSWLGYIGATSVGVGRVLNNRHWIGDVMTGALVGTMAAELGYWASGLLYRRSAYRDMAYRGLLPDTDLRLTLPWSIGNSQGQWMHSIGIGIRWQYTPSGHYLLGDATMEMLRLKHRSADMAMQAGRFALAWGRSWELNKWLSADTGIGIGYSTSGEWFPSAHASPRITLSRRMSCRFDLTYDFRGQEYHASIQSESFTYTKPRLRFGTSWEIRI